MDGDRRHLSKTLCLPDTLRRAIEAIYRDVDSEVSALGAACWARGDCCDFDRAEHRLYASGLETAYAGEGREGPTNPKETLCPFWIDRRCTARERRPLGCRTYFCDPRYQGALEAIHEKHLRRLRELTQVHALSWSYAEFVGAVRASLEGSGTAAGS
jgi:Fe-S-cluster containining protein